jgi:hypothetical protein
MQSAYILPIRSFSVLALTSVLALAAGCSAETSDGSTGSSEEDISGSCDTTAVQPLAKQEVDEINCIKPGTFAHIKARANLTLGSNVLPYLEQPAADALDRALTAHSGTQMTINSAFRTLGMQYALYQGRGACGELVAAPGSSNHEGGRAVDIQNYTTWQSAMTAQGWRWFGSADVVHFDYVAGGTDVRSLSVLAFQRLWNNSHPTDKIAEDGSYGPATATRLAKTPGSGLPNGPTCTPAGAADSSDSSN